MPFSAVGCEVTINYLATQRAARASNTFETLHTDKWTLDVKNLSANQHFPACQILHWTNE